MNTYNKKINLNLVCQIILFVVLIVIDQITKIVVVNTLKGQPAVTVIKGFADFCYLENNGAAFSILENAMWFFYLITAVVFIVIAVIWFKINKNLKSYATLDADTFKSRTFSHMNFLGYILAVLASGAIGNLIDRVINGYVVDFIQFTFINFPIFNFADICVTLSVIALCIFFIFVYKEDPAFTIFKKKKENNNE